MAKFTISGLVAGIILLVVFSTLPNQNVTDTKSAINNAGESIATDKIMDSSGQVITTLSEQAKQNACSDPNSNTCTQTKNSLSMISVAWIILIVAVIIDGLIGFSKWIIRSVEFITGFF